MTDENTPDQQSTRRIRTSVKQVIGQLRSRRRFMNDAAKVGGGIFAASTVGSDLAAAGGSEGNHAEDDGDDGSGESETTDWEAVGQAIGKEGELKDGGVYSVSWPRTDLNVTSKGIRIEPPLALGSHAEFFSVEDDETIVRGDLVLTEEEFNQVISRLQEGDVGQTAIHKHLLDESPPIWWTHIGGRGDPVEMAQTIKAALELTDTPMKEAGDSETEELAFDTERLDEIIGHEGTQSGNVYKYGIPRAEQVTINEVEVPPAMGYTIPLGFQPTSQGTVAINGDFICRQYEVDPVIQALRENDIQVVSLHNHFLAEEPRLFFMHFWANDDGEKLAQGLRAALNEVDTVNG